MLAPEHRTAMASGSAAVESQRPLDEVNEGWIACRDAASGEHLGYVPRMSAREVRHVLATARAAALRWRDTPRSRRRRVLASVLDEIVTAQDELARLATHESGKTMIQALMGDVLPSCAAVCRATRTPGGPIARAPTQTGSSGLVGALASPRFPLQSIVAPVALALAEGRGAIVRLSEHASWSGQMYVEIIRNVLRQHGHDPAIVASITGGPCTVAPLLEAKLDRVVASGPDEAARDFLTQAARTLTPVTWQRQGNEAMIVTEDADIDRALEAAIIAAFTPLPPPLLSAERILVHAACYEAFVCAARRRVRQLRQGMPLHEGVDCGAIAPSVGVDHVAALVEDACDRGATVLVGGRPDSAFSQAHYPPTLLVNVPPDARIAHEPTFGPVMAIMRVHGDAEAATLVNGAPTGAGVSIFGSTMSRARALSRALRSSRIRINEIGIADSLVAHTAVLLPTISLYPARPRTYAFVESLLRLRFGNGLRERLRAAAELRSLRRASPG
jgi:acyl-CoA reductase-like NAD-dependent aldehyde dehydrogenase